MRCDIALLCIGVYMWHVALQSIGDTLGCAPLKESVK